MGEEARENVNTEVLKIVGQVAGIGGIALGVFLRAVQFSLR